MRNDKHLAIRLRQHGKSYAEISRELEVPKSTLSEWLADFPWSIVIKNKLKEKARWMSRHRMKKISQERSLMWKKWREAARQEAVEEFPTLSKNRLFIAGLMIYWGEGDSKAKNPVRMANTDPRMISTYVRFLLIVLKVPTNDLRAGVVLYPDLNAKTCIEFWSKTTGIPIINFHKPQVIQGRHPTKRLAYGICSIIIHSRRTKEKFLTWIDLLSKTL